MAEITKQFTYDIPHGGGGGLLNQAQFNSRRGYSNSNLYRSQIDCTYLLRLIQAEIR